MVDNAAIRALRTMDLIPYILENPGISIGSLAAKFSVTEKQVENDLQLIFMCGLPGYTPYELIDIVFEDGIVSVIDPQVLDKPRRFNNPCNDTQGKERRCGCIQTIDGFGIWYAYTTN